MVIHDIALKVADFGSVTTVATAIVSTSAAIGAVVAGLRVFRTGGRVRRARLLTAAWQVGPDGDRTGAVVYNDSPATFVDVVVTVVCGLQGQEANQPVDLIRSRADYLWTSTLAHALIDSRAMRGGPDNESERGESERGQLHDAKPHGVQVTFGDGRGYWLRDGGRVERLKSLVIWAEKTRADTLRRYFGRRGGFRRAYSVTVDVRSFDRTEDLEQAFMRLADTGNPPQGHNVVPDIVVGPHDWIGRVARDESVSEHVPSRSRLAQFDELAIEALSRRGRLYAIPYVFDSVALIRNNAIAGHGPMPESVDELIAAGRDAIRVKGISDGIPLALQVGAPNERGDAGDPYHMWPLFTSAGGSFFGLGVNPTGKGLPDDIDAWRPEFVDAFVRLAELGTRGDGTLRPAVGRAEALSLFLSGRAPFLVCSSRALASIRERRLDVSVGAVPKLGANAARPMVSVYGFFIYRHAPNLPAARDLLAGYLAQPNAGVELNRVQQLVPVQREAMDRVAERDPVLRPYVEQCRAGQIMPSYPEMRDAWRLLGRTEHDLLAGVDDPAGVAERAATDGWRLLERARTNR